MKCDLLLMYTLYKVSIFCYLNISSHILSDLVVRGQGRLVHVAPVVRLLGEQHGGEGEGGGRHQGVVDPGVADAERIDML